MRYGLGVLTLSIAFTACSTQDNPAAVNAPAAGLDGLVRAFRDAGATVGSDPSVTGSPFSVPVQGIVVNGGTVRVFEYATAGAADQDAAQVSPNGSTIGLSQIHWVEPPHFYRKDAFILLYLGGDASVLAAMERVCGPQFSPRSTSAGQAAGAAVDPGSEAVLS